MPPPFGPSGVPSAPMCTTLETKKPTGTTRWASPPANTADPALPGSRYCPLEGAEAGHKRLSVYACRRTRPLARCALQGAVRPQGVDHPPQKQRSPPVQPGGLRPQRIPVIRLCRAVGIAPLRGLRPDINGLAFMPAEGPGLWPGAPCKGPQAVGGGLSSRAEPHGSVKGTAHHRHVHAEIGIRSSLAALRCRLLSNRGHLSSPLP